MTTALGGLDTVSNATTTGWQVLTVRPLPAAIAALGHASVSVDTRLGTAAVAWRFDEGEAEPSSASAMAGSLSLNVTVPVGALAEVHVPQQLPLSPVGGDTAVARLGAVIEAHGGGAPLMASRTAPRRDANASVFVVGSGVHEITAQFAFGTA